MNEDRCYADQHRGLFVVADGMGGHVGGEQASQTVIEVIASRLGELLGRAEDSLHYWPKPYGQRFMRRIRNLWIWPASMLG